jgi:ABC-type multidrug transport system ATPase subunit
MDWLDALAGALRRRGLEEAAVGQVVHEAAAHLRDSGQRPEAAFGPPDDYADAVAEQFRTPPVRRPAGPVRLQASGITKRFGRRTVLQDVDLTVRAGQIAAIVGANGCGKTTLLRICAGLVSPDAGRVAVSGRVTHCPQDGGTADFLLPDEHYVLVGAGQGASRRDARARGRSRAAELGWDSRPAVARQLSGGTRQKLNLVLSTMTTPDLLLLDEPYQGFDRASYERFWQQLWQLRDRGAAVVLVTHLLADADGVDVLLDLGGAA